MSRFLPAALYTVEVTLIALIAVLLASVAMHSTPVNIASGCTAAWFALTFLPCPCHRRRRR